ncbi:MAG: SurA N-terminal domain-containing protein, partial [Chloroflexota bacterium]
MKATRLAALLLLVAAMLAGCAEGTNEVQAVAIVNGEQVSSTEFEQRVEQETSQYEAQGIAVDEDEEMREQIEEDVLDTLIAETLILDYAAEQGIEASQEDIDAEYASTVEQVGGEDALDEILSEQGMDSNDLMELIADQIVFQRILEQEREARGFTVTEDDLRAAYEEY